MRESMLGKIVSLVVIASDEILRTLVDLLEKLLYGEGKGEFFTQFKRFLRKEECWVKVSKPKPIFTAEPYLRLISNGTKLTITSCSGKRTIAKANKVFRGYIDCDFVNYGLDVAGAATPDTDVEVHDLVRDGDFTDIYNSVGADLSHLVLTQDQVISFVKTRWYWLRTDGYGTFFLLKEGNEFFVVRVNVSPGGGLNVYVIRLSHNKVWRGDGMHRFVLPQLKPASKPAC